MIRIGVIGYGYWGPNLVRNFFELDDVVVVSVCDINKSSLTNVQSRYPSVQVMTDPTEVFRNSDIDAVAIATPVASHFELARQALCANKHVFIEKPLAANSKQVKSLVALARKKKLTLMVDHIFVYAPAIQKIKRLIDTGSLGNIFYFDSIRVNLGLFRQDVNVIWDLAIHDLSMIDFLFREKVTALSATGANHVRGAQCNVAYITLFFSNNLVAHINTNWLAPVKVRQILIGGSRKMIVYDELEPTDKVKVYDRGVAPVKKTEDVRKMLVSYRSGDLWCPNVENTEALKLATQHFVTCVKKRKRPVTDGMAGFRVIRLLEAANQSLQKRGRLVKVRYE